MRKFHKHSHDYFDSMTTKELDIRIVKAKEYSVLYPEYEYIKDMIVLLSSIRERRTGQSK